MPKIQCGGVYEIKINKYYVYVCHITEFSFGIFDYVSEEPANIDTIINKKFKDYKSCKRTGITKKEWKKIGTIDLDKNNIKVPDLVIFMDYDKEHFIERSIVMRQGNSLKVSKETYLALLEKRYIYGFFDNHKTFENYIYWNLDNIKNNKPMGILVSQKMEIEEYQKKYGESPFCRK